MEPKLIDNIALEKLWPLLDEETLFAADWQLRQKKSKEEWEKIKEEIARPTLQKMINLCTVNNLFAPAIIYDNFPCRQINNGLYVEADGKSARFDFPRERKNPNRCLADFFKNGFITLALVTLGDNLSEFTKKLFMKANYSDLFYIKGMAANTTEALMKLAHGMIRKELKVSDDVGERFSFGYPSSPELSYQKKLVEFLRGEKIGVTVTRTYQLVPEYSTSAMISIDPEAKRFIP